MAEDQEKSKCFKTLAEFYPYYKSEHHQTVSMLHLLLLRFSAILLAHYAAAAACPAHGAWPC
jgi:hypothetical protein